MHFIKSNNNFLKWYLLIHRYRDIDYIVSDIFFYEIISNNLSLFNLYLHYSNIMFYYNILNSRNYFLQLTKKKNTILFSLKNKDNDTNKTVLTLIALLFNIINVAKYKVYIYATGYLHVMSESLEDTNKDILFKKRIKQLLTDKKTSTDMYNYFKKYVPVSDDMTQEDITHTKLFVKYLTDADINNINFYHDLYSSILAEVNKYGGTFYLYKLSCKIFIIKDNEDKWIKDIDELYNILKDTKLIIKPLGIYYYSFYYNYLMPFISTTVNNIIPFKYSVYLSKISLVDKTKNYVVSLVSKKLNNVIFSLIILSILMLLITEIYNTKYTIIKPLYIYLFNLHYNYVLPFIYNNITAKLNTSIIHYNVIMLSMYNYISYYIICNTYLRNVISYYLKSFTKLNIKWNYQSNTLINISIKYNKNVYALQLNTIVNDFIKHLRKNINHKMILLKVFNKTTNTLYLYVKRK